MRAYSRCYGVPPPRTGWLTGGYRKDRELAESRSRSRLPARFDMSNPENQRKLDAADVTLSVDTLDRVDEIVPPGSTVSRADQGYLPPSWTDPFVRRRRTE